MFFDFNGRKKMSILDTNKIRIIIWKFLNIIIPQMGIIFWIVDKIKILFHLIFSRIINNQLWNGIIPSFIHNAAVNIIDCMDWFSENTIREILLKKFSVIEYDNNIKADAINLIII